MLRVYFINELTALNKKALESERLELDDKTIAAYKNRLGEACHIAVELGILSHSDIESIKKDEPVF